MTIPPVTFPRIVAMQPPSAVQLADSFGSPVAGSFGRRFGANASIMAL